MTTRTAPKKKKTATKATKATKAKAVASAAKQKKGRTTTNKKGAAGKARATGCKASGRTATPETCFWVNKGPVVKDLQGLRAALKKMTDKQFAHHTKEHGNDFSRWIADVLGCPKCAERLARARTRQGAARALAACR